MWHDSYILHAVSSNGSSSISPYLPAPAGLLSPPLSLLDSPLCSEHGWSLPYIARTPTLALTGVSATVSTSTTCFLPAAPSRPSVIVLSHACCQPPSANTPHLPPPLPPTTCYPHAGMATGDYLPHTPQRHAPERVSSRAAAMQTPVAACAGRAYGAFLRERICPLPPCSPQ